MQLQYKKRWFAFLASVLLCMSSAVGSGRADLGGDLASQVHYWQEQVSTDSLISFIEAYERAPSRSWPACLSRSHAKMPTDDRALLYDTCRGNGFNFLRLLAQPLGETLREDPERIWSGLNVLLDFRDNLRTAPSYVSAVMILAIEVYVYVEMLEAAYVNWSASDAEGILERLRAGGIDVEALGRLIDDETGRKVLEAARAYAEEWVAMIKSPHGRAVEKARGLVLDRSFKLSNTTFSTLAYLAERDSLDLPSDPREVAKEANAFIFLGPVSQVSAVELLAKRNLSALLGQFWRREVHSYVKGPVFLEFVRRAPRPAGILTLEDARTWMDGSELEKKNVVTTVRFFTIHPGSSVRGTIASLADRTFGLGGRHFFRLD
jgi:hypothetical protein